MSVSDGNWMHRAACRGMDLDLFFGPIGEGVVARAAREPEAKAVCQACPVRRDCLTFAIEHNNKAGVFGGMTEDERFNERRRRLQRVNTRKRREAAA